MALTKGLRQLQFMLQGWVRHARRRYLALSALIFGGLLLASIIVRSDFIVESSSWLLGLVVPLSLLSLS